MLMYYQILLIQKEYQFNVNLELTNDKFFQPSKCKFIVVNVKFTCTWLKTAVQNSPCIVENNGQSTYIFLVFGTILCVKVFYLELL